VRRLRPLALRLAARYRHTTEALEDLEQVASLGLLKAIDGYEPGKGPFPRYAVPTILGELKRHFRDRAWTIRVPRALQQRCLDVSDAVDRLSTELRRSPSPRDLAAATGLELEEVIEALDAAGAYAPAALDAPRGGAAGEEGGTLSDVLGDEDGGYDRAELSATLAPALQAMTERERAILHLRFGEDLTQSEIAERVGISQMHVSRLLRRSVERLSAAVRD